MPRKGGEIFMRIELITFLLSLLDEGYIEVVRVTKDKIFLTIKK